MVSAPAISEESAYSEVRASGRAALGHPAQVILAPHEESSPLALPQMSGGRCRSPQAEWVWNPLVSSESHHLACR